MAVFRAGQPVCKPRLTELSSPLGRVEISPVICEDLATLVSDGFLGRDE